MLFRTLAPTYNKFHKIVSSEESSGNDVGCQFQIPGPQPEYYNSTCEKFLCCVPNQLFSCAFCSFVYTKREIISDIAVFIQYFSGFICKKLTLFVYVTNLAITWLVFFSFFSVLADAYFYFDNNFEFICHKFQNLFAIVIVIVIFIFLYIMFKNVFFLCCSCFTYFSQPGLSRGRNPIRIYLTDFSNL